jgi:hypothetical protein
MKAAARKGYQNLFRFLKYLFSGFVSRESFSDHAPQTETHA